MNTRSRIFLVLCVQTIFYTIALFLQNTFGDVSLPFTEETDPLSSFSIVLVYVNTVVLAPLLEETVFRGGPLFFGTVFRSWSLMRPTAVILVLVSSVIWAVLHQHGLWISLALFSSGLLYSWLAFRSRSIFPGMACHAIWNFAVVTIALT